MTIVKALGLILLSAAAACAECTLGEVIEANYPGEKWTVQGNTYDGLTWLSQTPKPTKAALIAAATACDTKQAQRAALTRAARYEVRLSTKTAAQRINALVTILELDN